MDSSIITTEKRHERSIEFWNSTAEMGDPSTFAGWDFDQVWTIEDGYPQLQIGVPGIAPE